jgi:hypothetical protein
MTAKTQPADHLTAIRDLAKTVGIKLVYQEQGFVVFGDKVYADADSGDDMGVCVEISFNDRGEVSEAHKKVNGVPKGDVDGSVGNAGQRLLWTLHLFSRR